MKIISLFLQLVNSFSSAEPGVEMVWSFLSEENSPGDRRTAASSSSVEESLNDPVFKYTSVALSQVRRLNSVPRTSTIPLSVCTVNVRFSFFTTSKYASPSR